jgi:hypothetical protein
MMGDFLQEECGAVTTDWIVLTAGILLLGLMVTYTVLHDSAGYLMAEFEQLNQEYAADSANASALSGGTTAGADYTDK